VRPCGSVLARNADAAGAAANTEEEAAAAARVALSRTVWVGCCNFKPLLKASCCSARNRNMINRFQVEIRVDYGTAWF